MKQDQPPAATDELPPISTFWRHYKGGVYRVLGNCIIEATGEPAVLYRDYHNDLAPVWCRPVSEWRTEIPPHGPRFREVRTRAELDAE